MKYVTGVLQILLRALGMLIIASSVQAAEQSHGQPVDNRVLVDFPPMMRTHILSNMRDHLKALQEIQQHLSAEQFDQAAAVAEERLGMSSLQSHGAEHSAHFMPKGMQAAGTQMHKSASRFARVAKDAAVTGDNKPALAVLSEVMAACVACHTGYKIHP